jgi:hypothetical protein
MFLRFVTERRTEHGGRREGFFQAVYAARRDPETPGYILEQFSSIIGWFNDNLDEPDRFNRGPTSTGWRSTTTGLSWFRADANQHVEKAFELSALLREIGYPITVLKTTHPGFIVYEDDYQIVAEPFADTPT